MTLRPSMQQIQNCRRESELALFIVIAFCHIVWYRIEATLLDTSVACDQSNFLLTLNFDAPFRGLVYSEDGFPNCIYVNGTMLSRSAYQLKIPLTGCETRVNEDGNYENAIIVQENDVFQQATDKKYLLTCIPTTPIPGVASMRQTTRATSPITVSTTTAEITVAAAVRTVPSTVGFDDRVTSPLLMPMAATNSDDSITVGIGGVSNDTVSSAPSGDTNLKYSVEIRNGHALDAPPLRAALNIGDQIAYMVRLKKPIADSQVGRCWASDSRSSLELSDERGCSLQPRSHIWGAFERAETEREVIFVNRIKAWAFPTSNEVNIFCNLRICMSRVCSFDNCTGQPLADYHTVNIVSNRRKFRDDDNSDADMLPSIGHQLPRDCRWRRQLVPARTYSAAIFGGADTSTLVGMTPIKSSLDDVSAVHVGGRVGELTEVETLATKLRFRRQSLQRARHSDTSHLIVAEQNSIEFTDDVTTAVKHRHRKLTRNDGSDADERTRAQLRETDDVRAPPSAPPRGTFTPTAWRIAAVGVFLTLFAGALAAFLWLWRDGTSWRQR